MDGPRVLSMLWRAFLCPGKFKTLACFAHAETNLVVFSLSPIGFSLAICQYIMIKFVPQNKKYRTGMRRAD